MLPYLIVKMIACRASCRAYEADYIASFYLCPCGNIQVGHVRIISQEAVSVFDDDTLSIAPFVPREDNATRSGGIDLASVVTCKVYSMMSFSLLRDGILSLSKGGANSIGLLSQRIEQGQMGAFFWHRLYNI